MGRHRCQGPYPEFRCLCPTGSRRHRYHLPGSFPASSPTPHSHNLASAAEQVQEVSLDPHGRPPSCAHAQGSHLHSCPCMPLLAQPLTRASTAMRVCVCTSVARLCSHNSVPNSQGSHSCWAAQLLPCLLLLAYTAALTCSEHLQLHICNPPAAALSSDPLPCTWPMVRPCACTLTAGAPQLLVQPHLALLLGHSVCLQMAPAITQVPTGVLTAE